MAAEKAREFLEKLRSDEALAEKADDAYVAGLLAVAREAGYDVSEQDLRATLDAESGALPDADLENVAGGSSFLTVTVTPQSNFNTATSFNTVSFGGFNSFSPRGFVKG